MDGHGRGCGAARVGLGHADGRLATGGRLELAGERRLLDGTDGALVLFLHLNFIKMFIGYWSSPVSIPKVFDTTPCLEHMLEYEECVAE